MMKYRHLIFVKTVVLRSCVPCVRAAAGGSHLLPAPNSASSVLLPARCLSNPAITKPLCSSANQRQTLYTTSLAVDRTPYHHQAPSWQSTCVHLRCLHSSHPTSSADAKKDDGKTPEEDAVLVAKPPEDDDEPIVAKYDESGKPLSNWKRMKIMMKTYGYVVIPVHWVIAPVWFGMFYYAIKMGVDIGPILLKMGVSEHHVNTMQNSGASNALMAYALYKIFTPVRYTVTVGATEMTVRYLRKKGYIKPTPPKEKSYRDSMRETMTEMKDKAQDVRDKAQETTQNLKDKAQDVRDKAQETTQNLKDKAQDVKDKAQETTQNFKDKAQEIRDKRKT
ncbi:uncharacterized protein [Amphiura filiformis]|uniref:uncharacterized protein n=1 Tax=Amphiura filiformis TaxID=82378 RepID=UPI003B226304